MNSLQRLQSGQGRTQSTKKEIFYKKFLGAKNGCFLSIVGNENVLSSQFYLNFLF